MPTVTHVVSIGRKASKSNVDKEDSAKNSFKKQAGKANSKPQDAEQRAALRRCGTKQASHERQEAVMCHICGCEFAAHLLTIHLMHCEKAREAQAQTLTERDPVRHSQQLKQAIDAALAANSSEGDQSSSQPKAESPASSQRPSPRGSRVLTAVSSASEEVLHRIRRGSTLNSLATTNESRESTTSRTVTCPRCGRDYSAIPYGIHKLHCGKESEAEPKTRDTSPEEQGSVNIVISDFADSGGNPEGPVKTRSKSFYRVADNSEGVVITQASTDKLTPGPLKVLCYICGREFGIGTVDVHMPQCRKRFEASEALKPPEKQRTLPTPPEALPSASPEEYNALAQESWFDELLVACQYCGKSFPEESLMTHQRSCHGETGKVLHAAATRESFIPETSSMKSISIKKKQGRPNEGDSLGRLRQAAKHLQSGATTLFGKDANATHTTESAARHEAQELAKKEMSTKTLSVTPEPNQAVTMVESRSTGMTTASSKGKLTTASSMDLSRENSSARSASFKCPVGADAGTTSLVLTRQTVTCQICGREFGTATIEIHTKQCARKFGSQEAKDRLERCEHCGNMFLPERLHVHQRTCNKWKDLGN